MQETILGKTQKHIRDLEKLATQQVEYEPIQKLAKKLKKKLSQQEKLYSLDSQEEIKSLVDEIHLELSNIKHPQPNEDIAIYCPVTDIELYKVKNGYIKSIAEHGQCRSCKIDYHVSHLKTKGMLPSPWPVRYKNYLCKTCWEK